MSRDDDIIDLVERRLDRFAEKIDAVIDGREGYVPPLDDQEPDTGEWADRFEPAPDEAEFLASVVEEESPATPMTFPLVRVNQITEIHEQDWLVEGLIPRFDEGAAGYIFGPPKARKSLLLSELALCVATGESVLGCFPVRHTGAVIGFFAEDSKAEASRRIHRLARARGIEVPDSIMLIDAPAIALDSDLHQRRLLASLRAIEGLALVWLDPMVRLHSINDNRAEELGPIHTFLRTLSRSLPGAVIVLAHHTNKGGDSRGSTDYNAFGDFNLYLSSPDGETTSIDRIENRGGPPGEGFAFEVEDLAGADGPAMRLRIVDADPAELADATDAVIVEQVLAYRDAHTGVSGRAALKALKRAGLKIRDKRFWAIWRSDE